MTRHRADRAWAMLDPMAWWHDFFDDDAAWLFGPTLGPERTEAEVAGAWRLLRLRDGERVADLGCGTGRHAVALQRRGARVAGLEWSPSALSTAQRTSRGLELACGFVRCDLRRAPFRGGAFDAAICLFSSLGYEPDDEVRAMLAEARRILRPGGRLLVEVEGRDHAVRRFRTHREWTEVDGVPVRIERRLDLVEGEERALFHFDRGTGPRTKPFRRRLYTATELRTLLAAAGFDGCRFHGDYEGGPHTLDSAHLLAVARNP